MKFRDIREGIKVAKARRLAQGKSGGALSVKGGRVSEAQHVDLLGRIQAFHGFWGGTSPVVDPRIVEFVVNAAFVDPTVSNTRKFLKHLTATKLKVVISDRSKGDIKRIHARLNDLSKRINKRSGGMRVLIQRYIDQLLTTGAISAEDVIADDLSRVDDVVLIPTQSIRFKYENGAWQPYQASARGTNDIKLNSETFRYLAAETMQGNPYAIPPFLSSCLYVLLDQDITGNLRYIFKKFGLMGLVRVLVNLPEGFDSEDPEDVQKMNALLQQRLDNLNTNFDKNLLVMPNDSEMDVTSPVDSARSAPGMMDRVTEKISIGAGVHPALSGPSDRPADKFANVIYRTAVHQAESYQGLCEDAIEDTYELDLVLGGIDPAGMSAEFEHNPAFDPLSESQARTTKIAGDLLLLDRGAISIEDVAQEYSGKPAFNPDRAYGGKEDTGYVPNLNSQQIHSQQIKQISRVEFDVSSGGLKVVMPFLGSIHSQQIKQIEQIRMLSGEVDRELERRMRKYVDKLKSHLKAAGEAAIIAAVKLVDTSDYRYFKNADEFAKRAWDEIAGAVGEVMSDEAVAGMVGAMVNETYRYYRLHEASVWGGRAPIAFAFGQKDYRTLQAVKGFDSFYLGKYVESKSAQQSGLAFLKEQYLEKGEGLFGRADKEVLEAFRDSLGLTMDDINLYQTRRIVDTSVVRMRSYGQLNQMWEAGVSKAKWVRVGDYDCPICNPFDGMEWDITNSIERVDREIGMTPEEFASYIKNEVPSGVRFDPQSALDLGDQPPLHPNCKCRMVAVV